MEQIFGTIGITLSCGSPFDNFLSEHTAWRAEVTKNITIVFNFRRKKKKPNMGIWRCCALLLVGCLVAAPADALLCRAGLPRDALRALAPSLRRQLCARAAEGGGGGGKYSSHKSVCSGSPQSKCTRAIAFENF